MNTSQYSSVAASRSALPLPRRETMQSAALFLGRQEVVIRHDGQDYRLRITRQNKLILTK